MGRWQVIVVALVTLAAACGEPEPSVDSNLVGTWEAVQGNPVGVVAVFNGDGMFTWSEGDINGTFEADGSTLTFSPSREHSFCAGGTLTGEYQIQGDTLTSDVVASDCPEGQLRIPPESPDWVFERR